MIPLNQCLCCLKPVPTFVPKNNSAIYKCCEGCKNQQLKLLSQIKHTSLENIQKNINLNAMFDSVAKSECDTTFADSNYQISSLYKGSIELRKYMFSLLEEINKFSYEASFECILYTRYFKSEDKKFFSDRFFQRNAVSKVIGAWEKIIRFHSLYFGIIFDENKKRNSLANLSKKLNKTDYTKTKTYKEVHTLKSKSLFKQIDDTRKIYDHRLSYEAGNSIFVTTNIVNIITLHCSSLYECLVDCIDLFKKSMRITTEKFISDFQFKLPEANENLYKKKSIRVQKKISMKDLEFFQNKSIDYLLEYECRLLESRSWNIKYSSPPIEILYYRLFDVTVRLHEAARSLAQMIDMYNVGLKKYSYPDEYWIHFDGLNYRYFLLSSLLRVYSVYDKLAIVIQEFFEVKPKRKTFEGTIEYIRLHERFLTGLPPMKICNRILSNTAFKKIYRSRQNYFHLLTTQNFLPSAYKEISDFQVFHAIIENSKLIYELIDSIDHALINFHLLATHQNK
ncbi:hypothetical protein [Bacillus paralicheniformis]|uniref:hypothetical protein n=1 Tax=Bacillus paralicheniformis TaxID=1648923 RepID=UPI001899A679|nr:hypothetical protein [Bacillus paralicheniformis]